MLRRSFRRLMRSLLDASAMCAGFAIQYAASGSFPAACITAAFVGLYGAWCFFDGLSCAKTGG